MFISSILVLLAAPFILSKASLLLQAHHAPSSNPHPLSPPPIRLLTNLRSHNNRPRSILTNTISNAHANTPAISPLHTATRPRKCNGYTELCLRRFSNITYIVTHNSPFAVQHNIASNQEVGVEGQLEDGVRGFQFQTHASPSNPLLPIRLCHTSCALLDAGTLEAYLTTVRIWISAHPDEVITLIIGNADRLPAERYVEPFTNAGLIDYLHIPSTNDFKLETWPTLEEMITTNKRVVVLMDYRPDAPPPISANTTTTTNTHTQGGNPPTPWLHPELALAWETPFSPTNPSFPCTIERPPSLSSTTRPPSSAENPARKKMYLLNHNLNLPFPLPLPLPFVAGSTGPQEGLLLPALPLLASVNAASGPGSLGANVDACVGMWGRAPSWLLVDFYNRGGDGGEGGSVFEVAGRANGVGFERREWMVRRKGRMGKGLDRERGGGGRSIESGQVWVVIAVIVCAAMLNLRGLWL